MVYWFQHISRRYPMEAFFAKLKNFWYYYKIPVGIGLAVLVVGAYFALQSAGVPEPDYHIGLISAVPRSDAALAVLTDSFAAVGNDLNGDGQVLVKLHTYYVDLADDSPNAGVNNANPVAALDADLIGKVSGIFLAEDPQTLQTITGEIFKGEPASFGYGLHLLIRSDAPDAYKQLAEAAAP